MRGRGVCLLVGMKAGAAKAEKQVEMQQQQKMAQQQAYEQGKQAGAQQQAAAPAQAPIPTPAQAPAPSTSQGADLTTQLQNLANLRASGLLSDEEFAAAKKKLLG